MAERITIRKPDDWHLHVRDGAMLKASLPFTAEHFGRAILMPNLLPPVLTVKDASCASWVELRFRCLLCVERRDERAGRVYLA